MDRFQSNLTNEQIERYLDRIKVPASMRRFEISALSSDDTLKYLGDLQMRHLTSVPFENLTLHYSPHRQIAIGADDLYTKIIESSSRGGYCMENNSIFALLLRSLGFQCYLAGGRVFEGERYTAWSHVVILVTVGGKKYEVDVGFGSNCPTHPLCLDDSGNISANDTPASVRLINGAVKGSTAPDQRLWIYQYRMNDLADFVDTYCFTEVEYLANDLDMMNYFTSTNPRTMFTQRVVCVKYLRSESTADEIDGIVILLNNGIKWRRSGMTIKTEEFESESKRLVGLEEHFGIMLSPSERNGIRKLVSEIKS